MCRHVYYYHGCRHTTVQLKLCTPDRLPSSALFCDHYSIERDISLKLCGGSGDYCKHTTLGRWIDTGPALLLKRKEDAGELQAQHTAIKLEKQRLEQHILTAGPLHLSSMLLRQEELEVETAGLYERMADVKVKVKATLDRMSSAKEMIRKSAVSPTIQTTATEVSAGVASKPVTSTPAAPGRPYRTSSTPYVLHAPSTAQRQSFLDAASQVYQNSTKPSPQKSSNNAYLSPGTRSAHHPFKPNFSPSSSFGGSATKSFGQYDTPKNRPSPLRGQLNNIPSYDMASYTTPRKKRGRASTKKPTSSARAPTSGVRRSGRLSTKNRVTYEEPSSNSDSPSPPSPAPSSLPAFQESLHSSPKIKLRLRPRRHDDNEEETGNKAMAQKDEGAWQPSNEGEDDDDATEDGADAEEDEEDNDEYRPTTTDDPHFLSPILSFTRGRGKRAAPSQLQSARSKRRSTTTTTATTTTTTTSTPISAARIAESLRLMHNLRAKLNIPATSTKTNGSNQPVHSPSPIQVKSAFSSQTPSRTIPVRRGPTVVTATSNANSDHPLPPCLTPPRPTPPPPQTPAFASSLSPLKPAKPISMTMEEQRDALARLYAAINNPTKRGGGECSLPSIDAVAAAPAPASASYEFYGGLQQMRDGNGGMGVNVAPTAPSMVAPVVSGMTGMVGCKDMEVDMDMNMDSKMGVGMGMEEMNMGAYMGWGAQMEMEVEDGGGA